MFTSIQLIGIAILLAFAGTLAGCVYALFVLGFVGVPGAVLTELISRKSQEYKISIVGLLLTVAGQTYASLAFVVLIVLSVRSWIGETTGIGKWVLWLVGFCVAIAPACMALKDGHAKWKGHFEGLSPGKIVPYYATASTAALTIIGFFIFAFFPHLTSWGWGWVPHF